MSRAIMKEENKHEHKSDMFDSVPNPEDYPEHINEHCRKCKHGKLTFFRSKYWRCQSILCGAYKANICLNGFIKHEEFMV